MPKPVLRYLIVISFILTGTDGLCEGDFGEFSVSTFSRDNDEDDDLCELGGRLCWKLRASDVPGIELDG